MNPYLEIVVRSVAVYIFILAALRFFGKKELSQLNTMDIVLILLISNAVQNAMVGQDSSLQGGIVAAASLFLLNFLLKKLAYRSKSFRNLLNDKPEVLIHDGKLDFERLSRLNITSEELQEAMREHGVQYFKEVKLAMLEADGNISIISGSGTLRQTHYRRKRSHKSLNKTDG